VAPPYSAFMKPLSKKIALVAGGSRGAGRGIALALGDAGATVYVAARSYRNGPPAFDNAPDSAFLSPPISAKSSRRPACSGESSGSKGVLTCSQTVAGPLTLCLFG
jgi:hypothetical protein